MPHSPASTAALNDAQRAALIRQQVMAHGVELRQRLVDRAVPGFGLKEAIIDDAPAGAEAARLAPPVLFDNDGDIDLVAGNRGLNSKITADLDEPCLVYAKDFDGNGSYDAVLGYYIWGKPYPMYHRDQLIDQMPMMRKKLV